MGLAPGTRLGTYLVAELLGSGGMGEVYRARDLKLAREVALKVLPAAVAASPERRARFEREARLLASLNHPHISAIYQVLETDEGLPVLVLELVEGETLDLRIARGPLPLREAFRLAVEIAGALDAAHERGILHRDLKPSNVKLTRDGQAKLLDFGLAKAIDVAESGSGEGLSSRVQTLTSPVDATEAGAVLGTAPYMSPEQVRGEAIDRKTDLWAFGCVLFEMLTGRRAFAGATRTEAMAAVLDRDPDWAMLPKETPEEIRALLRRCLRKERTERLRDIADVRIELKEALEEISSGSASGAGSPRRSPAPLVQPRGVLMRRWALVAGAGLVVLLAALASLNVGGWWERLLRPPVSPSVKSLAVLPLANITGDKEQDYFADGMTDELIGNLAKISALKVISRTSVMRYKETKKPLPEIARELNVDAVVEGTVARSGNRVRITAQLIRGRDDRLLWADQYESDLRDVLTLQDQVAQRIAAAIRVKLTAQEHARLASARPLNPQAYEAYLKGRYYWNKVTEEELSKSIEFFQKALEQDPVYAPAYVGLADSYILKGNWDFLPPKEAFARAREAATKALEIDGTSGEAYAALAYAKFVDRDMSGAQLDFNKAIELSPNYATARLWYTLYLRSTGHFDEAILEAKRGQELDPLSPLMNMTVGSTYYRARQYDQALIALRKALDLGASFPPTHFYLGLVYLAKGMYEQAVTQFQQAAPNQRPFVAVAYAFWGKKTQALKIMEDVKSLPNPGDVVPCIPGTMALIHAGLGERDQALRSFDKASRDCDPSDVADALSFVQDLPQPVLDSLRSDPRFQDLVRRFPPS